MTSKRRWLIPFAAALLTLAALPVWAQTQAPATPPAPAPEPTPRFCVGVLLENGLSNEWCYADFMACVNGYGPTGGDLRDDCSWGLCICYYYDLPQLPPPAQCYAAYERCLPPNPNDIPPASAQP